MLGVKTTCKDRWRQILSEAKRIDDKHLLTLESPISPAQTEEMKEHGVQLVIPKPLHKPYRPEQQQWLMSVDDFISTVGNAIAGVLRRCLSSESTFRFGPWQRIIWKIWDQPFVKVGCEMREMIEI